MFSSFISITNLQRQLKKVFYSKQPMHVVLSNNAVSGIVFSKEAAELLLASDTLNQIREELWELQDEETRSVVLRGREGKTKPAPFDDFAKEYGV
ncbi:hypothetical protein A3C37_01720 [Candidatus Peribacteria bacterium RIFCSPHIGHO2_02_FULL_53_20]|nr:MAG: hypothetical protein A3C37_01720 [Candidatus Peribacteria bacterium RIFCSPHIGHO2_02_FULL_53_20]OGJ66272.1 MAG: hypothetical protein A3B61_04440 [Candidatus Peribacteria bacterium RIFCSPLOWO2_01_FULL_53_10]OGJ70001.1 MAG: hypothetical protein A3G69_05210 [Candidatus Peribacteria bacterium RIFCSPLOWO2_12_FULL_53_10]